ncbi:PLP-dependent aminotransferase family protein [Streptomyces longispororuber]|uniref:MocR-like pyridoxine biosynthesis transcription factor PdxR n=1 Tax=Streptomyces longispororuber TaxID=68230 RepID=UPI0034118819
MALHIAVDVVRESEQSLTSQIQRFIRKEILEGILHPGTRLPSSRRLADDLGVSRSVVVEAFGQLVAEGYLEAVRGAGTRVVEHLDAAPRPVVPALLEAGPEPPVPDVRWDLRPGGRNFSAFPRREWLTCYQRVLHKADATDHGYPPLAGEPGLRTELAHCLGRLRGVRTSPHQVMVAAGFAQTLSLLCAVLAEDGHAALAIEDPGHPGQRRFVRDSGLRPVPVPVDAEGIDVDALTASGARAVLVTPAHQFPTGARLSARRREALVRWARAVDGWVIEDDYDGGVWYDRDGVRPLALQREAPDHVVYAGTASKSLAPGLRLGWAAAPRPLLDRLLRVRARHDLGTDTLTQLAFAELLRGGLFDRHLRRLNARCRSRRTTLEEAVARHLPGAAVAGPAAGLHAYVRLPHHVDEAALVAGARARSVLVRGGAAFHARPQRAAPALVVGHAHLPASGVTEAVRELAAVLARP